MPDVLLQELTNVDIDWLAATGQQHPVAAGTLVLAPGEDPEVVHFLLKGTLSWAIPARRDRSAQEQSQFSTSPDDRPQDIMSLTQGEVLGVTGLFNLPPLSTVVRAIQDSILLSIPKAPLLAKLRQDVPFSARVYRAIALILSERLQRLFSMPGQLRAASDQPMKAALLIFGELCDSDVDWLVAVGHLEKLAPRAVLIQAGRPLEALYIVLDGTLSVAVHEGESTPLTLCFDCVEKTARIQKVIDRLSRGEMSGTLSVLTSSPSPVTIRAMEEALVLAIPRSQLSLKLQQDVGFAARFYRVLTVQLLETLRTAVGLLGCPRQMYQPGDGMGPVMDQTIAYDDELDCDSLHQVAQGAARFNWMLKRVNVM